jgi:predicted dehydrogenase
MQEKKLKVLFFGLGSIGEKHARIIKNNYEFELYAFRTKKGQEKNRLKIKEFYNLDEAFSIKPDIAFITNPTYLHMETSLACAKRNIALFIEKPISNSLEKTDIFEKEIKKRNLFSYVAYNIRFHPVISNLVEILANREKPIFFRAICSSYLPNWRKNQDYSKSYSAKKEFGGGVILDLSHEFDYINWLFGEIKNISGFYGKISDLKINSEDILNAKISCKSGVKGSLHLDYFSHNVERRIQIYYNNSYIEGDMIKNTIKILQDKKEKTIKYKCHKDSTYKKQLNYFFKNYQNGNYNVMNNFSEALKTFKKIMEFKKENIILI